MNRTNIVLAGVLVILAVIYVATRDSDASKTNVKLTKIFIFFPHTDVKWERYAFSVENFSGSFDLLRSGQLLPGMEIGN